MEMTEVLLKMLKQGRSDQFCSGGETCQDPSISCADCPFESDKKLAQLINELEEAR